MSTCCRLFHGSLRLGVAILLGCCLLNGSADETVSREGCVDSTLRAVEIARVAFLIDATRDGSAHQQFALARGLVDALHSLEHVYVVRLPSSGAEARTAFDDWVRQKQYANVFAAPEDPRTGGSSTLEAIAFVTKSLLTQHRDWDYLVELVDTDAPAMPVDALATWLGATNGSSFPATSPETPAALARGLISQTFAGLQKSDASERGDRLRAAWASAKSQAKGGSRQQVSRSWAGFWKAALDDCVCGVRDDDSLAVFFSTGGSDAAVVDRPTVVRNAPDWSVMSPIDAHDAGHVFKAFEDSWWTKHKSLLRWMLHALVVHSSAGDQRVQKVHAAALRTRGLTPAQAKARRRGTAKEERVLVERVLQAALQMRIRATISPTDGMCKVPGAASGVVFQLSSCSVEAEVFLSERLFLSRLPWTCNADASPRDGSPCADKPSIACGVSPRLLIRVGTSWDGDREQFDGMVSVIPQDASSDLWIVLHLIGSFGRDEDVKYRIELTDMEGETTFEGGGLVRPATSKYPRSALAWDRYLGPKLEPGTHTITVRSDSGDIASKRTFEVIANAAKMPQAERLKLFPRYFELVSDSDEQESLPARGEHSMPQASGVSSASAAGGVPDASSPVSSEARRADVVRQPTVSIPSDSIKSEAMASTHAPSTPSARRARSIDEIRAARKRAAPSSGAPQRNGATGGASTTAGVSEQVPKATASRPQSEDIRSTVAAAPAKPARPQRRSRLSAEEWQKRELDWIRLDVQRFAVPRTGVDGQGEPEVPRGSGGAGSQTSPAPRMSHKKQRGKPVDDEERARRELEWIRHDVQRHVRPSASRHGFPQGLRNANDGEENKKQHEIPREAPPVSSPARHASQDGGDVAGSRAAQDVSEGEGLNVPRAEADEDKVRLSQDWADRESAWIAREAERLHDIASSRRLAAERRAPDVAHAADAAEAVHPRSKPQSAVELEEREQAWILKDIKLHVPADRRSKLSCNLSAATDPGVAADPHTNTPPAERQGDITPAVTSSQDLETKDTASAHADAEELELADVKSQVQAARERAGLPPITTEDTGLGDVRLDGGRGGAANRTSSLAAGPQQAGSRHDAGSVRRGNGIRVLGGPSEIAAAAKEANITMEELAKARESLQGVVPEDVIDRELPWILRDIAVGRQRMPKRT